MQKVNNNAITYTDGEIEINVSLDSETVWLSRQQLSALFDRDIKTIGKHINNVFKEKELEKNAVVAKFATTAKDGKTYNIEYYNLDVIISMGYRVKSQKGVKFRQWATKVLKQYIYNGYAINSEKITHQRFKELENEVNHLKEKVSKMDALVVDNALDTKQGIFFDGQVFDAYVFMSGLIKKAKRSIILIDNYIDETTLTHLSSKSANEVKVTILTKSISKAMQLDLQKHNEQYSPIVIKTLKHSHDRFLLIDEKIYHLGASLKDLGKKWFAFSLMEEDAFELKKKIEEVIGGQ